MVGAKERLDARAPAGRFGRRWWLVAAPLFVTAGAVLVLVLPWAETLGTRPTMSHITAQLEVQGLLAALLGKPAEGWVTTAEEAAA